MTARRGFLLLLAAALGGRVLTAAGPAQAGRALRVLAAASTSAPLDDFIKAVKKMNKDVGMKTKLHEIYTIFPLILPHLRSQQLRPERVHVHGMQPVP